MNTIPVVDLENIELIENASKNKEWLSTADKVREGLGEVGFLYLTNHGVPEKVVSQAFEYSEKFFKLPTELKLMYKKNTSNKGKIMDFYDNYTGYTPLGVERLTSDSRFEMKEVFDWTDRATDDLPDEEVAGFKEAMITLDTHCKTLMKKVLKLMALALGLDEDFFLTQCKNLDDPFKHPGIHIGRINHYPPISDDCNATRCAEHTDYAFLTLLFQDIVGGLEVKSVDGTWITATPIPGSIILNTGDLTEFWTSGIFPATMHRVFIPADDVTNARRKKSRFSIAVFCGPDNDTTVTPMDLDKRPAERKRLANNGRKYSKQPINAFDHVMRRCANHSY